MDSIFIYTYEITYFDLFLGLALYIADQLQNLADTWIAFANRTRSFITS
jgi:hypothetical protein